jgi:hypothetical protein
VSYLSILAHMSRFFTLKCVNYTTLLLNHVTVTGTEDYNFVFKSKQFTQIKIRNMKKVLLFASAAIFFASCGNNQETADKAKMDAMSQELAKQRIIDSMNSANAAVVGASAAETNVPAKQGQGYSSNRTTHSSSHTSYTHNTPPSGNTGVNTPPTTTTTTTTNTTNTVTGPTAEEIAAKKKADHKKELNSAAAGALIGAGAGAIGGALGGKNEHFKKEDAAIGGGIGAVVGAGAGLLLEKRKLKRQDTTQH